uniref:Putative conserved secreted protein n=1 Tax=Rhipicephalus microplus TaxID=6941 RepID=A0A6G5A378_RHIMP
MKTFKVHLVAFAIFLVSSDWYPSSNVMVEAGRLVVGKEGCWRYDCSNDSCEKNGCECPSGFLQLFGIRNCR